MSLFNDLTKIYDEAKKNMNKDKETEQKPEFNAIEFLKGHKECVGICVGSCCVTGKWSKGDRIVGKDNEYLRDKEGKYVREAPHSAHAHTAGPGKGYICFHSFDDLKKETTLKHELSHIITGEGHTINWAKKYVELGTPKWLTVEWLQKKYGFDNEGNEGNNLFKQMLKAYGIDEKDIVKGAVIRKIKLTAERAQQILNEANNGPPDLRTEAYLCKLLFDGYITQAEINDVMKVADRKLPNPIEDGLKKILESK